MYIYLCVHECLCIYMCVCVYIHECLWTRVYVGFYIQKQLQSAFSSAWYIHMLVVCVCIRAYVCMACFYTCMYVCMHVCVYVCMYVYMYAHIHIFLSAGMKAMILSHVLRVLM